MKLAMLQTISKYLDKITVKLLKSDFSDFAV